MRKNSNNNEEIIINEYPNRLLEQKEKEEQQQSKSIIRYIKSVGVMNKNTAREYFCRGFNYEKFILSEYNTTVDKFTNDILQLKFDPYEMLGNYCIYLQEMGLTYINTEKYSNNS